DRSLRITTNSFIGPCRKILFKYLAIWLITLSWSFYKFVRRIVKQLAVYDVSMPELPAQVLVVWP
ncbi:MAG: hypothetical protein ACWGQW_19195, partial [bacterium]